MLLKTLLVRDSSFSSGINRDVLAGMYLAGIKYLVSTSGICSILQRKEKKKKRNEKPIKQENKLSDIRDNSLWESNH